MAISNFWILLIIFFVKIFLDWVWSMGLISTHLDLGIHISRFLLIVVQLRIRWSFPTSKAWNEIIFISVRRCTEARGLVSFGFFFRILSPYTIILLVVDPGGSLSTRICLINRIVIIVPFVCYRNLLHRGPKITSRGDLKVEVEGCTSFLRGTHRFSFRTAQHVHFTYLDTS